VRAATPHEVRIAVKAAAVSPTDLLVRELGAKTMGALPPPWTPGMERDHERRRHHRLRERGAKPSRG
jgi:hypothetical protein